MPPSLAEVESMVDQLSAEDQAELRRHLSDLDVKQSHTTRSTAEADAAWADYLKIGAQIAALPSVNGKSVTEQLSDDRR